MRLCAVTLLILASISSKAVYGKSSVAALPPLPVGPGVDQIQLICDEHPLEQGLIFGRAGTHPTMVEVDGNSTPAWVADKSISPNEGWKKTFGLTVTDPRFQKGGRPVVELEFTCHLAHAGGIILVADTKAGSRVIAREWHQGKGWETYRVSLDDAFFGARPDPDPAKPVMQGFDLRLDAANNDLYLRSVRVVGFNPEHDVQWSRLLQIDTVSTRTPSGVLVWQKGPAQTLQISLQNLARIAADFQYRLQVTGYDDKARWRVEGKLAAPPSSLVAITQSLDTGDWPLGPYDLKFEVFSKDRPTDILYSRRVRLGLVSPAVLEKARPGEFLYGLDAANNSVFPTHTPVAYFYYRLMGVDMLRNPFEKGMKETPDDVGKALTELAAEDLQSALMCDPVRSEDPAKTETLLQKKVSYLTEVARRYAGHGPGKIRYFELGNEPDLPRFFPGPISEFIRLFNAMREAIKTGAKAAGLTDADTVVATGGLSFAGMIGPQRAEEIIKGFDPAKIDAIAYHGHGPDIHAERNAYERVHAVAEKYHVADHVFYETESGFSGQQASGLEEQARTVVEKMVYAQSKQEPFFIFFRLFMEGEPTEGEGGYSMTENFIEPRPSVMAYRNLVERLRHRSYVKTLDIEGKSGIKDIDGYVFVEKDARGGSTGRKTAVLFAEASKRTEVSIALDPTGAAVTQATLHDMYGNGSAVSIPLGGVVAVPVTKDPVFLSWTSAGDASRVEVTPPPLALATLDPLLLNTNNTVSVIVHNTQPQPVEATVSLDTHTRVPSQVSPASLKLTLPASGSSKASFTVKAAKAVAPLRLPFWWKVFTDVDVDKVDLAHLAAMPDSLPGTDHAVAGQFIWAPANRLDFGKLAGSFAEHRVAVAVATLDSTVAMDLPCAASADWYMAWYCNGTKVQDTLTIGNKQGRLADHTFNLPLKKGCNLIVAEVLSGSGGWRLDYGGPKERQVAVTGGNDPDSVSVTCRLGAGAPSQLVSPVRLQETLPVMDANASLDQLATWMQLEPLAVEGEGAVKNLWMKEPDSSRWYQGSKDLAATFWLYDAGQKLECFVAVTDDKFLDAASPDQLAQGDAVRLVLADDDGKPLVDVTGGMVDEKPVLAQTVAGVNFLATNTPGQADTTQRTYRMEISKSALHASVFRLSVSILDNDAGYLKQTLDLGNVDNPSVGFRLGTND